ncbi:MAG TPA: glycoside hydrolase family 16 protein [Allosphingosinicella sp.]|jgi:beta-glucanase (GH16 family)
MKLLALTPLALLFTAAAPAPAQEAIGRPAGYSLVWADEFKGSGMPDTKKWAYDTAFNKKGWFNEEKQYYSNARSKNSRVRNGRLIIEAHAEKLDPKRFPDWGGQPYTSARLFTRGIQSWQYGYFEARAKLPCGLGTWPAIWTLSDGTNTKWPDDGEIDIMEHVAQDPGTVHHSIHTKAFNHVAKTQKTATSKVPDACTAFHDYQLLWTRDTIRMGIDGRELFRFDRPSDKMEEWPFDRPHYLILNLAMGGWGGLKGIDDSALPEKFEVDYVRVYQAK